MANESVTAKRCAIYTRKSSEEGLEQAFNSLDAQREACASYIASQRHEGWRLIPTHYNDGGFSGASLDRPALTKLLADVGEGRVDVVVVYKVDRLTRSLADFAKIVELFDRHSVSFVSVTQQFNTTTSMGRLTLNVLLSFAQFEREVTGERIRDKFAASRKKGMWMGGNIPLGYDLVNRKLAINSAEAATVRLIFRRYVDLGCVRKLKTDLERTGMRSKVWTSSTGRRHGGVPFSRGALYTILKNRLYIGEAMHKGIAHPGQHQPILETELFGQAQARLATNRAAARAGERSRESSLLRGLLADEKGTRLSPSHTVKDGRRYRYYVSQTVLQYRQRSTGSPIRVPAHDIERLVREHLHRSFSTPAWIDKHLGDDGSTPAARSELIKAAANLVGRWEQMAPREQDQLTRLLLHQVTIGPDFVQLSLSRRNIKAALTAAPGTGIGDSFNSNHTTPLLGTPPKAKAPQDLIHVRINAHVQRSGRTTRLKITDPHAPALPQPNPVLVKAVVRANLWFKRLMADPKQSIPALAKEYGLPSRYVRQILRLAFLAPDITEAIVDGHQPPNLQLRHLIRRQPLAWPEQRRTFGFPSRNGQAANSLS